MAVALTEPAIARAVRIAVETGQRQELADRGHRGLWLRIGKSGTRTWALRARAPAGSIQVVVLGHHPAMGLAEARRAATRKLVEVREGIAEVPSARPTDTLAAVLDLYTAQRGRDLKSWPHSRKRVERVFADLLGRPVHALTTIELQLAADKYPARQSAAFAVRTLRPVLRWAAKRGLAPAGLWAVDQPVTVQRRDRALDLPELGRLLPHLDDSVHGKLLRFLLLTLARLGEASSARWGDIGLEQGLWTIPDTKSGEPHAVPLSRQALALLAAIRPQDADSRALVFATRTGAPLGNWDRATKRLHALTGTAGWHRHDLRRTGATLLGELGTEPHVIEAALNHVSIHSRLAATYNKSRYREPVAAALQRLADLLDRAASSGAEVVSLRRAT